MSDDRKRSRITHLIVAIVLTVYFVSVLLIFGVSIHNDSQQYISMHIRRDPVYSFFLFLIRQIFGGSWLMAAGVLQTIIVIASSFCFIIYISERLRFNMLCEFLVCGLVMLPYIVTPFSSTSGMHLSSAIISESLTIPEFLLFFVCMHRALTEKRTKDILVSFLAALLLALTRSSMSVMFIVWLISVLIIYIPRKSVIRAGLMFIIFVSGFAAKDVITKSYNLVFNGAYVGNLYAKQTALANILYVTDPEARDLVEDDTLKQLFDFMYYFIEENRLSYRYAPENLYERADRLEEVHDPIKFYAIEYNLSNAAQYMGIEDYIDYNAKAEEFAGAFIRYLFPACAGRWFADFLILGFIGVTRSIAFKAVFMYPIVVALITFALICMIRLLKKDFDDRAGWLIFLSVLMIFANAYATASVIMCLSRYMIYGFPVFYTSILAGVIELYRKHKGIVVK